MKIISTSIERYKFFPQKILPQNSSLKISPQNLPKNRKISPTKNFSLRIYENRFLGLKFHADSKKIKKLFRR